MTTEEMRELDAWIAENVMGWKWIEGPNVWSVSPTTNRNFFPTIWPNDAMDVLKKCAERGPIVISEYDGRWVVSTNTVFELSKADSLELSICLTAKQLFSNQATK